VNAVGMKAMPIVSLTVPVQVKLAVVLLAICPTTSEWTEVESLAHPDGCSRDRRIHRYLDQSM
jgi:hypothetical protein